MWMRGAAHLFGGRTELERQARLSDQVSHLWPNHVHAEQCIYDNDLSLWHADEKQIPAEWNPAPAFAGQGPPWFLVAQSNTGISAEAYRERLVPLLRGTEHMPTNN